MRVERLVDPAQFLERAGSLLLADEARHNLVLGIAGTLRDRPGVYGEHRLWLVEHGGSVVGAALQTPPFNLVLARPRDSETLGALVDALLDEGDRIPGVTAALPEAEEFAEAWRRRSGRHWGTRMRQCIYRAASIRSPEGVAGSPRTATANDRDLLVSWVRAFTEEALHGPESPASEPERAVDARLTHGTGGFVLWKDAGEPVSVAGWGGRTPNGVRIGPVYTPPECRRRGYGSAVTAAVSAEQLASGRSFCFLYTDLANPTSNRIYADIGYEPVCDSVECVFEPE